MTFAAARAIRCDLQQPKPQVSAREPALPTQLSMANFKPAADPENGKIFLQPRLCTLRSFGSDRVGVIKTRREGGDDAASPFFETLSEYIESSKKSRDFEIISGRVAMIVFAATVAEELVTGNSLFRKMDLQGIEEAGGACLAAVMLAATFAWFSSARNRVGRIFKVNCSAFIDSLIDQIVDGLFYESELSDWSDEI